MENNPDFAQNLIKSNLETRNPILDIGRCRISDLQDVPELVECTHLETLILSDYWMDASIPGKWQNSVNSGIPNQLTAPIPSALSRLKNLKRLFAGNIKKKGWKQNNPLCFSYILNVQNFFYHYIINLLTPEHCFEVTR